jgi:folate-binding protein YgfZ
MLSFNELQNASATFRISGPDANTYLQGQFTQDLRISPGQIAYGLWLNQKGKVLADSTILRFSADEHLVFSARTAAGALRQRLEDYLIADDVSLVDESAQATAFQIWGDGAAALLAQLAGVPVARGSFARCGAALVFADAGAPRVERGWLLVDRAAAETWRARLRAGATESSAEAAERARLHAGIPAVPDDIGPDDLPNEGGLDGTAISYTKGCYLGQEVMSRLKNLGQVRRQLHVVHGDGIPPAPRTELAQSGKRVGEVRSSAPDGAGFVAFAMLSRMNFDPQSPLHLPDSRLVTVTRHG